MSKAESTLLAGATRAYEHGRIRAALPWALSFPTLLLVGALGCGNQVVALVLGLAISVGCVLAAWRGGLLKRSVCAGFWGGLVTVSAPLLVRPVCAATGAVPSTVGAVVCMLAGVWMGRSLARGYRQDAWRELSIAGMVAMATASIACGALGAGALLGLVTGSAVSLPLNIWWTRRSPAA